MIDGGMVSISSRKITGPFDAAFISSLFKVNNRVETAKHAGKKAGRSKGLTARVRHQLRSMPQLNFYIDDTLGT